MVRGKKTPLLWHLIGSFIVVSLGMIAAQENVYTKLPIAADSPFRSAWYKRALDTGMLIWSDMDALSRMETDDMLPDHRLLVLDASLGRLIYLEHCLQKLFTENQLEKDHADFGYLARIIVGLHYACQELDQAGSCDRLACFKRILEQVDQQIALSDGQ